MLDIDLKRGLLPLKLDLYRALKGMPLLLGITHDASTFYVLHKVEINFFFTINFDLLSLLAWGPKI